MLLVVNPDKASLAARPGRAAPKVVLTGGIGAGKSTVVQAVRRELGWTAPAGFRTHWGGGARGAAAICLEAWGGAPHVMARRVERAPGFPYQLDTATFVAQAAASLRPSPLPVVLDELGVLELAVGDFTAAIARIFREARPVLAVIQHRALDRWLDIIQREAVTSLLTVDSATRAHLPRQIADLFRDAAAASA